MANGDSLDSLWIAWGVVKRSCLALVDTTARQSIASCDALLLAHQQDWNELKARYRRMLEEAKTR